MPLATWTVCRWTPGGPKESRQPGGFRPRTCVLAIFADAPRRPVYIAIIPISDYVRSEPNSIK